ncbi:MAG: Fe-S cluster assembly protein SufD [Ignavibacteria bacterium]|nr:Fe-S cluster assembly protein SufD [Ignavibacteria bacterium]
MSADIKKWYAEGFKKFEESLNGESKLPIHQTRISAIEEFNKAKFPTLKDEEWKYTNLAPLLATRFEVPKIIPNTSYLIPNTSYLIPNTYKLVFVNGIYDEANSQELDEPGITLCNLKTAIKKYPEEVNLHIGKLAKTESSIFTALSTAYINDGVFLKVKSGYTLDKPVQILYITTGAHNLLIQPRNLFIIGKNAQAKVVETYTAQDQSTSFTNAVTESVVDRNGRLEHIKIQEESLKTFHISNTGITLEKESTYASYNINFGGSIVRNDLNARFNGEHAHCTLNGLYIAQGTQHIDNHTLIDHAVPNCESHEMYKGVLDHTSRAVFNGKVFVRKDAQKTNAFQENKTVLLSDSARIDTKPQLEIFADDVKCSHGATIGKLSDQSIFYLRARGISEQLAKTIIINAFANDAVHTITIDSVRQQIEERVATKLSKNT